jgi:choline kinase
MRAAVPVHQTVILAAGTGARLCGGVGTPKPLIEVGGIPLLARALAHAAGSGCREAIIVLGHQGARVRRSIEAIQPTLDVRFVENPNPSLPNGESLLVAASAVDGPFFLQMVDHVFASPVLPRLASRPFDHRSVGRVLADRAPVSIDISDATRLRLAGDRVTAIGKQVDPWDAIDAGCFLLKPAVFDAVHAVSPEEPRTVSAAMRQLVRTGALEAVDIDGVRWIDVDTPSDLEQAEILVRS